MKTKLLYTTVVIMLFVLAGCGNDEDSSDEKASNEIVEESISPNNDSLVETEKVEIDIEENEDSKFTNLNDSLGIELLEIIPRDPNTHDSVYGYELNFVQNYVNHTDKDIKGFMGESYFYDMFDELVYTIEMKYEWDIIPANDTIEFVSAIDLNQFKEVDMRFYNLKLENMRFDYRIDKIIFTDGTSIQN